MNIENFDLNLKPTWRQGYRFQFEPAQKSHVILYPEGALLHKDLKCKAPLIEPNLRRNLGKWST